MTGSSTSTTAPATTSATPSTRRSLRLETDWKPRYGDVRAGLEATIEWYATHRDWWEAAKVESERTYARLGR